MGNVMKRIIAATVVVSAILMTSACTQNPVDVTYKGKHVFGRGDAQLAAKSRKSHKLQFTYSEREYISGYKEPARAAKVESRELAPVKVASVPVSNNKVIKPATVSHRAVKVAALPKISQRKQPSQIAMREDWSSQAGEKLPRFGNIALSKANTSGNSPRFIWPVRGKLISSFGPKKDGARNDGINIAAPEGEPVFAAADGVVVYAGNELPGYGNMIILRHNDGWMTAYAHASGLMVKKDESVQQGDLIAYVGATGGVKTAQLHFGVRKGTKPVNPEKYMSHDVAGLN